MTKQNIVAITDIQIWTVTKEPTWNGQQKKKKKKKKKKTTGADRAGGKAGRGGEGLKLILHDRKLSLNSQNILKEPAYVQIYNKTCVTSKDSEQPVHSPGMARV